MLEDLEIEIDMEIDLESEIDKKIEIDKEIVHTKVRWEYHWRRCLKGYKILFFDDLCVHVF